MRFHSLIRAGPPFIAIFAVVLLVSAFVNCVPIDAYSQHYKRDGGGQRGNLGLRLTLRSRKKGGDADWDSKVASLPGPSKNRNFQHRGLDSRLEQGSFGIQSKFSLRRRFASPELTEAMDVALVPAPRSKIKPHIDASLRSGGGGTGGARNQFEVAALLSMKAATEDPLGALKDWHPNASTACGWAGVLCLKQEQRHHVIALDLGDRQLGGDIGSVLLPLGRLEFLQELDLSTNSFHGSLRGPALANMSNLQSLNLSDNQIAGPIPMEIGELGSLETLSLAENNLTGRIPVSLGNCSSLAELILASNFLQGSIPDMFDRTPKLKVLDLGNALPSHSSASPVPTGNSFSGSLPPSLGNCSSLQNLHVQGNPELVGDLPFELRALTELQVLDIGACGFTGTVPDWLGNLSSLERIEMSFNSLRGGLPDTLGKLSKLVYFAVEHNSLSGALPVSITNCTNLQVLEVSDNNFTGAISDIPFDRLSATLLGIDVVGNAFTGSIPPSIANCSSLESLQLGLNPFDPQPMPRWIGSFPNMTYLYLVQMNLHGHIPTEIGNLQQLQKLLVSDNNLTGEIPSVLGNCTGLSDLELRNNELTGALPPELGELPSLSYVILGNLLTGPIPSSFSNLSQLTALGLDRNFLTGSLDVVDWGRLWQLQELNLGTNSFVGSIPSSLGNCSELNYLLVNSNNLTGPIPLSVCNLSRVALQLLDLSSNQLSGQIPAGLLESFQFISLSLQSNSFEGMIPPEIGDSTSLQVLDLSHNGLQGNVPESLGNCSKLLQLSLSHNQLSGSIPSQLFSQMIDLTDLDMSHNLLSGTWPQPLSSLQQIQTIRLSANNFSGSLFFSQAKGSGAWTVLQSLDVSINNFDGSIPESLGLLSDLTFLNVSFNNFQGPIPEIGIFQDNLTRASFLGNPGLCGDILGPGRECSTLAPASSAGAHTCKGFTCRRVWILVACVGLGLLLPAIVAITAVVWLKAVKSRNHKKQIPSYGGRSAVVGITESEIEGIIRAGEENVIGRGAYSVVYRGSRPGGDREFFAIKVLNRDDTGRLDEEQLFREVHTLAQLRHRNVVRVLSFFSGSEIKAIVLEYVPLGSLHKHLYAWGVGRCQLSLQTRLEIALGTAEGIKYLHHDLPRPLVHGDLKPTNILLDSDFTAKVADFGLAKFVREQSGGTGGGQDASASTVRGTLGYIPPEYAFGGMSTRGDVYSYGIVLLEMLTGTPSIGNSDLHEADLPLHASKSPQVRAADTAPVTDEAGPSGGYRSWILNLYDDNSLQMLDAELRKESRSNPTKREQMMLMLLVALLCTRERPQSRPTMSDVCAILAQINRMGADAVDARRTIDGLLNDDLLEQNLRME